jgi:hypothetical protein
MTRTPFSWTPVLALVVAAAFAMAGCNEATTPIGGTGDLVVASLTSSNDSANVGGTVIVEASVENSSGTPQSGVTVTFSVTPSTAGSFTSSTAATDANGLASTIFNASNAGSAAISAEISGGSKLSTPLLVVVPDSGGVDPGSGLVSVAISPKLMQADGSTTATVTITAYTPAGVLVPDSTAVKLTAGERFVDVDGDGYFTAVIDTLKIDYNGNSLWDAIGLIPSIAYTTSGVAAVTYTAGDIASTVYIRATVGDAGSSYYGSSTLTLTPNDSVANIELFADQAQIQVHATGGDDFTTVTATCFDAYGNRAPEGLPVALSIVSGPGGGEGIDGIVGQPVSKLTTASGQVSWTVSSGTISGTVRLRATAGTVLSTATQIVVSAGPAADISLGSGSLNIRSWDFVNRINPIVAVVVDVYGNPVPNGTTVYFSTEEGSVEAYDVTEDEGGVANVDWHSGDPRNDGIVWIYGETAGGTVLDSTYFISSGAAYAVTFITVPTSIQASSDAKADVVVQVLDVNGNFVVEATPVDMSTDFGSISGGVTADGITHSTWETEFTSEKPTQDYSPVSPDDGIVATATVVAESGSGMDVAFIDLLSGTAYFRNCTMDYWGELVYGVSVPVEVSIHDREDIPLGGHSIVLTTTTGSVSGSPAITNQYGVATFMYTAPADSTFGKSAYLTATDNDPRGGVTVVAKVEFVQFIRSKPGDDRDDPTVQAFSDK